MYRALCVHADPHRLCACENARGSGVDDPRSLAVVNQAAGKFVYSMSLFYTPLVFPSTRGGDTSKV